MEIVKYIQLYSNPWLDGFFQLITMFGEDYFFILITTVIFWCVDKKAGYRLGLAYLFNGLINWGIKETVKVPRIIGQEGVRSLRVETAGGYSFPSGHTQSTTSIFTSLSMEYKKRWLYFLTVIITLLVALSRLYLGVHRLVDVIGGMTIGVIWVIIFYKLFNYLEKNNKSHFLFLLLIPVLIGCITVKEPTYFKAAGTVTGFLVGYYLESKYVKFTIPKFDWRQLLKLMIGLAVILALKIGIKSMLPLNIWSDFLRYAIIGLWVTVVYPYIFERFNARRA